MLQTGLKGSASVVVTQSLTAQAMGSGTLQVFATPAMIALIEEAAWRSIAPELEEGWGSVGTALNVQHLSATPVGMTVTAEAEVSEVDRRRVVFSVRANDATGMIGKGTHERFLVENEKFQSRADAKNQA